MRVAFDLSFSAFLTRLTAPERQHTIQGQACLAGVGSSPRPGPHIRVPLLGSLATYHPAVLDVDLSACTFLDCSGVRVFPAVHARATATGCLVRARHPQPVVRLVLKMTGLPACSPHRPMRTRRPRPSPVPPHHISLRAANPSTVLSV